MDLQQPPIIHQTNINPNVLKYSQNVSYSKQESGSSFHHGNDPGDQTNFVYKYNQTPQNSNTQVPYENERKAAVQQLSQCATPGCDNLASFQDKSRGKARSQYCKYHKQDGMVQKRAYTCLHPECSKQPNFNYAGEALGIYCLDHKLTYMINVNRPVCGASDCLKAPTHNLPGETVRKYCEAHASEGMVFVKSKYLKTCRVEGCDKVPSYNHPGSKKRLFCTKHKGQGMVIIGRNLCQFHGGCSKYAYFDYQGKRGKFCGDHKVDGMIWVANKRKCEEQNCVKLPCYKWEGEQKKRYCEDHKLKGMVYAEVEKKHGPRLRCCHHSGCTEAADYILPGEKGVYSCYHHKSPSMVRKHKAWCGFQECTRKATHNFPNSKGGIFCAKHRIPGMINKNSRTCQAVEGCAKRAKYNLPGIKQGKYCGDHMTEEMVNVSVFHECEFEGCLEIAIFKHPTEKRRRFCRAHKLPTMILHKSIGICQYKDCGKPVKGTSKKGFCILHQKPPALPNPSPPPAVCAHQFCKEQPVFNWEGETMPRFCSTHQLLGMVVLVQRADGTNQKQDGHKEQAGKGKRSQRCLEAECGEPATHSREGAPVPEVCEAHMGLGMSVWQQMCHRPGCQQSRAPDSKESCEDHRVRPQRSASTCFYPQCSEKPTFGFDVPRVRKIACKQHAMVGMMEGAASAPVYRRCREMGCSRTANFNTPGEKRPAYCAQHRPEGVEMVNVWRRPCIQVGCKENAVFGIQGNGQLKGKALWCDHHRTPAMVQVVRRTCAEEGCGKGRYFNYPTPDHKVQEGPSEPLYCQDHKKPGMVCLRSNRCLAPDCKKGRYFNYEGASFPLFCGEHRQEGMVNFDRRKRLKELCSANSTCKNKPLYNFAGEKGARFCLQHRQPNMVKFVRKTAGKSDRRCRQKNCRRLPHFNFRDQGGPIYCHDHKHPGMVAVPASSTTETLMQPRVCYKSGCEELPSFNFAGASRAVFCTNHRLEGMVFVEEEGEISGSAQDAGMQLQWPLNGQHQQEGNDEMMTSIASSNVRRKPEPGLFETSTENVPPVIVTEGASVVGALGGGKGLDIIGEEDLQEEDGPLAFI